MKKTTRTLLAALTLSVFTAACGESPMAPDTDVALSAAFGKGDKGGKPGSGDSGSDTTSTTNVDLENTQWLTPLAEDITVAEVCSVGVECLIQIEELKAYLTVPFDALDATTTITMTALAGTDVNFEFQPHGTQFRRTVKIKVDAANTNVESGQKTVYVKYWEYDPSNVIETFGAKVFRGFIMFETDHFSGYAIAM